MLVATEIGLLAVWDPASLRPEDAAEPRTWIEADRTLLERLNEGRAFFFATGGDGSFKVSLREGALDEAEEKRCIDESAEVGLTVTSGRLVFGSPEWRTVHPSPAPSPFLAALAMPHPKSFDVTTYLRVSFPVYERCGTVRRVL